MHVFFFLFQLIMNLQQFYTYFFFFHHECYFFPVWVEFERYSLLSPPPSIQQVKGVRLCTGEVCALVENDTDMSNSSSF